MPDGRFLGVVEATPSGGPNSAPAAATPTQLNVVINWFEELKRLVPAN